MVMKWEMRVPGHAKPEEIVALNSNPAAKFQENIITVTNTTPYVLPLMEGRREIIFQMFTDGYLWMGINKANVGIGNGLRLYGNGTIFGLTVADKTDTGVEIPISFIADSASIGLIVWQMGV